MFGGYLVAALVAQFCLLVFSSPNDAIAYWTTLSVGAISLNVGAASSAPILYVFRPVTNFV
jgi:hypothetical protein